MTIHVLSEEQMLANLEEAIIRERRKIRIGQGSRRTWETLKAVAADVRGRLPQKRSHAVADLEAKILLFKEAKTPETMQLLSHIFITYWPTIKQALVAFEKEAA